MFLSYWPTKDRASGLSTPGFIVQCMMCLEAWSDFVEAAPGTEGMGMLGQ